MHLERLGRLLGGGQLLIVLYAAARVEHSTPADGPAGYSTAGGFGGASQRSFIPDVKLEMFG